MRFTWFVLLCLALPAVAQVVVPGSTPPGTGQPATIPPPQPTRPEDICTLEGQVVNSLTGEPLKKAQIIAQGGPNNSSHGAVSDAGGRFVIESLDPGQYSLSAERNGFVDFRYGSHGPNHQGAPLVLDPGQHRRDLVFRMIPQGVITGKVVDEDGEPVEGAQISAMRYMYIRGKRQMASPGSSSTDDQGEYRIFGLEPGKYYLSASYRTSNGMGVVQDRKPTAEASQGYAPTYFPGTNDPTAATPVQLTAGSVLGSIDIKLRKTRTVRIRGHIVNPDGAESTMFAFVTLMPKDSLLFNNAARGSTRARDGAFEIRDVVPGSYVLVARWQGENARRMVRQNLDVGNSNLDDLNLVPAPPVILKGQVRAEGSAEVNLAAIQVLLSGRGPVFTGNSFSPVANDGSLTFENVNADSYSLIVRGLPPGYFVKSARFGDADVLESGLDLTRGGAGMLDILINPNGGQIDGSVADPRGQMAPGAAVVLVPDSKHREHEELFQHAMTDTSGHFTMKGVTPGDYKLFAWEEVEAGAYLNPEFLEPYENQGESVTIREGARENVQLKVIPADATPNNSGR